MSGCARVGEEASAYALALEEPDLLNQVSRWVTARLNPHPVCLCRYMSGACERPGGGGGGWSHDWVSSRSNQQRGYAWGERLPCQGRVILLC